MMIRLIAFLSILPIAALADGPRVLTDIAPIHSLTAQVMGDVGTPDLLLPPGADPHDFALRPSDAQTLSEADLIIWVGSGLTPWLAEPLATLAPDATNLALLDHPDWEPLDIRKHGEDADHDAHGHDDIDPHGWLDPAVARAWTVIIRDALIDADPDNTGTYRTNASAAIAALHLIEVDLATQLSPYDSTAYVLPHDGYQYFEHSFNLQPAAALTGIDARTPGPAQIARLRDQIARDGITCVFSDPEVDPSWVTLLIEGTEAKTAHLDATGNDLTPGPDLYPALLRQMADAFAECLS